MVDEGEGGGILAAGFFSTCSLFFFFSLVRCDCG